MSEKFYITSAIPYVNARPHIGHALEFVQTNVIARYQKILGKNVTSLSGGDENALKNVQAAEAAQMPIREFIDLHNDEFLKLTNLLNATYTVWQRGSDEKTHFASSQLLWQRAFDAGDIYQKSYSGLYCVGCEVFYTQDELNAESECFEHPGKKLEVVTEENYFFRLSAYQDRISQLIESDELLIVPKTRKNEVLTFVKSGLSDISISRSNERARNWGVPVPGDPTQRMYVWFDALNIYQSGVGFGIDDEKYSQWWPADLHVIGKGIIRFHAVYWPAFLMSAGLPLPKSLLVHEYITVEGMKMSKTLGNVFDPVPLIEKHGPDPLRYFLLAKLSPFSDGDFSVDKFYTAYASDLSNGLGNTISRVAALCEKSTSSFGIEYPIRSAARKELSLAVREKLEEYRFDLALASIWERLAVIDKEIEEKQPWKLTGGKLGETLLHWVEMIRQIAFDLQPFLPDTSEKISTHFNESTIVKISPLFPRV